MWVIVGLTTVVKLAVFVANIDAYMDLFGRNVAISNVVAAICMRHRARSDMAYSKRVSAITCNVERRAFHERSYAMESPYCCWVQCFKSHVEKWRERFKDRTLVTEGHNSPLELAIGRNECGYRHRLFID